jgi:heterodisulfide reductase subunit A
MLEREPLVAFVDQQACNGCFFCRTVCPYDAVEEAELSIRVNGGRTTKIVAVTNEGKCMGCGICSSACPPKAIMVRGFTDQQIYEEVINAF